MGHLLRNNFTFTRAKEIKEKINTFIFDYDGVFTNNTIWLFDDGSQVRTGNTLDGFALKSLIEEGFNVAIISGAKSEGIKKRLEYLGVKDIFLEVTNKLEVFNNYIKEKNISPENVMYMGDDIPDLPVLNSAGIAFVPADGKVNVGIKTSKKGGDGCVREVIEEFINLIDINAKN